MKCGIIGLPNVGKSTFFNCLSKIKVKSSNYPFCTIEPNISIVEVPDVRLYEINKIINSKKIIPSVIKIVDIAGLVRGAHKGKGLGNKFLSNIRETQAIIHVLRLFKNENIIHMENNINPIRDKEIIDIELQIKDIEFLENYLEKINKKKLDNKNFLIEKKLILKIISFLNNGKNAREIKLDNYEKNIFDKFNLLTAKPVLYLCNIDNIFEKDENNILLEKIIFKEKAKILFISAEIESKIANCKTNEEKDFFLKKLNIKKPKIFDLINETYKILNLQSYFTCSNKEIKSWTIKKGTTALEASSIIHSDFKKGFIRAEIIHYNDFIKYKSEQKIKNIGKMFLEGKNYKIQDGDIVHFRFNV